MRDSRGQQSENKLHKHNGQRIEQESELPIDFLTAPVETSDEEAAINEEIGRLSEGALRRIRHEEFKEAALKFLFLMDRYGMFVTEAENSRLAAYQGGFAIGLRFIGSKTYEDVAKICGVGLLSLGKGRAAVSKGVVHFSNINGLSASPYMKKEAARSKYDKARINSINERNEQISSSAG